MASSIHSFQIEPVSALSKALIYLFRPRRRKRRLFALLAVDRLAPPVPARYRTLMERELRDVVSKLTACVAMRYAAESNLPFVAEREVGIQCEQQVGVVCQKLSQN